MNSVANVVQRSVEALNKHDAAAFAAVYAPDAVVYDPYYPEPLKGRDAIQKDISDFFRAFPDIHNALRSTLADGQIVAAEFTVSGTHQGPLTLPTGEIPATGRSLRFDGGVFARVNSQGEIVEEHRYFDLAGQLEQLGLT